MKHTDPARSVFSGNLRNLTKHTKLVKTNSSSYRAFSALRGLIDVFLGSQTTE